MTGSLTIAKAFEGNAAFFLAALLAANMNKIKKFVLDRISVGDKRKDVREVNRAVIDYLDSEYVEDLINKLAAERYTGFTERSPVVKDFKTRMRYLFKLPSMKKIVPKLVSQHIQEKENRRKSIKHRSKYPRHSVYQCLY